MTHRRARGPAAARRTLAVSLGVLGATALTAAPAHAAGTASPPAPAVTADATHLVPGRPVTVTGTGWAAGATVQTEVCGLRAVHGSADCDTLRGAVALVAADGTFRLTLVVGAPPVDCPCVVRATTGGGPGARSAATDVEVAGVPETTVPDPDTATPDVQIVDTVLTGRPGLAELFGGRPRRTLVVTVRNTGTATLGRSPLVIRWGTGGTADTDVVTPLTSPLEPGARATYRVSIALPMAAFGRYAVGGTYAAQPFLVATDLYPWGLLAAAGGSVLLTVFATGLAIRRRLTRPPEPVPPPRAAVLPAPATVEVTGDGLRAVLASLTVAPAHPDAGGTPAERLGLEGLLRTLSGRPSLVDTARLDTLERLLDPRPTDPADPAVPVVPMDDASGAVPEAGEGR
ncbi:hypothetical protein [Streptomyces sp. NPDC003247]|uniref:hypothetical protein n=1 Tax=Streptomyces sp. NPDC003247 TaxID=3364677 RepID=UPI0036C03845